jgi:hypothetical protein
MSLGEKAGVPLIILFIQYNLYNPENLKYFQLIISLIQYSLKYLITCFVPNHINSLLRDDFLISASSGSCIT